MANPNGRPRNPIDPEKVRDVYRRWRAGRLSFTRAAQLAGCDRDALRLRFAEFDPEMAAVVSRRRAAVMDRYNRSKAL